MEDFKEAVRKAINTTMLPQVESFIGDIIFESKIRIFHIENIEMLVYVIIALIFFKFAHWLFFVPCSWIKDLHDVSYDLYSDVKGVAQAARKRDIINRIRRLRKIGSGDLPPPFPNGWYAITESSDLKPGDAKSIACLGEQFVIYRTMKNKVFVLDAYCPHMGANLGVGGRVIGNNIECPFHLWTFSGEDGMCTSIPYSSCVPQGTRIKKWTCQETNDFIFIWFHSDPLEKPWELSNVKEIESKNFVFHGRNEFYVNCHIQEIPENGADIAHFKAIHNASMFATGSNPKGSVFANAGTHQWQAAWAPSNSSTKHIANISLKHSIEINKRLNVFEMDVEGKQIGPSYVELHMHSTTFGKIKVLQTVTPIEPLVQKVVHRFYAPRVLGPIMKVIVFGESIMFERDMAMWNNKMFRTNPQLTKEDAAIKGFRNWFSQFYSDNSKTYAESCENLNW